MNGPFSDYYLRPKRVYYPPLDFRKHYRPKEGPDRSAEMFKNKRRYNRTRIIVDKEGNLQNVLSMGCASHSESEISSDPDTTTYRRQIYKRVKIERNKAILESPAIKLSSFKNLKPKVGFKAKLGAKNDLLVEIVREINRFIKFSPRHRMAMHSENITPFYNVYNWTPVRKRTLATRMDSLFLQLKQMKDNLPDGPCIPKYDKPNRDQSWKTYIGSTDPLGGQLYSHWLCDYRRNTRKGQHKKIVMPLSHKIIDFHRKRKFWEYDREIQEQSEGATDIFADPLAFNFLDSVAQYAASVVDFEETGNFYKYLSQEVPETCIVYRQPYYMRRALCRSFVDNRFDRQHRLLSGYLVKSLKPDPFNAHDYWERALHRFKYQVYVSKVTDKLLYHKMLKSGEDLEDEDLCGDCHSSSASSYGEDNEPKRRYTYEMAKQGAIYAYVHGTNLNRKSPTRLSVLFRLLMKRYLENDKIRWEWEKLQCLPSERKLSYKNEMRRLATGFIKRWYFYPMEWDMYTFINSLIIIRTGVLGHKEQPICHTPPPSDNEEELNFFIKYHFPPEKRKRVRKTIKKIRDDDELGKRNFKRLMELRELFKDPKNVLTRTERAEAIELRRKINLYMLTPNEKEMLKKLKMLRWFFIKRRFKYYKKKDNDRIEWRTTPIYSIKKNSPFTHDEIVIMCIGNGNVHYLGKLTRKEILLLSETAEEYHKNGLLNMDKDKAYILGTVIPLIKAVTRLHVGIKMRVLNSKKFGPAFNNRFDYLLHQKSKAMEKAALIDKNVDINCERCRCFPKRVLVKGDYKCDPLTFIYHLSSQLTKVEHLAEVAVRLTTLRHRVIRHLMFVMWEYNNLGRSFFRYIPTRDCFKLKTIPRALLYNTLNTPYGVPQTAPMSLYRVLQCAIAGTNIGDKCFHRVIHTGYLSMIISHLRKYIPLRRLTFMGAICDQMVNKSVSYMLKYKNTFRKITKLNKSVKEKRKLKLRGRRLKGVYTLLAQLVNWRLQKLFANRPKFKQEFLAYYGKKKLMSIFSTRGRRIKDKKDIDRSHQTYDEENVSPMMFHRNSIDTLQQNPEDFHAIEDAIIRRYRTLINELREIQQLMRPQTFANKGKRKKRDCYLVIRSMYKNLKVGKINSHRIAKSFNVWLRFDAHIRSLMDDFNDYIDRILYCYPKNWPPKEKTPRYSHLFEFERPKIVPKQEEKFNECTYNKKLRVLFNNKDKKILGGYRSLKLGTDWTSKYHEIIQRKFIKVEQFQQQKDSYVIQAGKMAAKGCEKVVKKCLYALSLFGFQKKDLELALLVYGKIRIMVKTEPKVRYPFKDKLLEESGFLDTKHQIYSEVIDENRENISKFKPDFISWRRLDNNYTDKVLVEDCGNPKLKIEKYFYGLDLRHTKSRKFLTKNELFDLHDYKYYDYKSDDDFSNKLDYSSDSSYENRINTVDFCVCGGKDESHIDKDPDNENNKGRRISNDLNFKDMLHSDSNEFKHSVISMIQDHHKFLRDSQTELVINKSTESYPDLYTNTNNFRRHSKRFVLKNVNQHKRDKLFRKIMVSSDNDSSSTSYDTKFRLRYFKDKIEMEKRIPNIMESDLRIQSRRKERRKKYALRVKLGGELRWRKTPQSLQHTFEKFLNFKLSHLLFRCQDFRKHVVPKYHPHYYLRHLPVIQEDEDTPLMFSTVANFQSGLFEKGDRFRRLDPGRRRGTEELDAGSFASDTDSSPTVSYSPSEESKEKVVTGSFFDYEKSFVSKYDDTYQKLKGHDYLKLKEEIRNEIENFKQLLRYEKECLVQNAHSNDILMEIAERAEKGHSTEDSLLSKRNFLHEPTIIHKCGVYSFEPKEWQDYFDWIQTKVSLGHRRKRVKEIDN